MGFLRSIGIGAGQAGGGAIVFWCMTGVALGAAAAAVLGGPAAAVAVMVFVGGVVGACVGLYAAWGGDRFARALALPGAILEFLF
jgi:hypothetical protein